ncbi:MAG TPA: SOS response-associated peptidase [Dehalococcoidia bacterium]|nr:SOS response-associated peptidase [Dehalococcoidia bacterium]
MGYTPAMCGRFSLTIDDQEQLAKLLGVDADAFLHQHYRPRYNIAPTDDHWLLRVKQERRELLPAKWGLVNNWAKDAKKAFRQINARAESIDTRSAFREAFKARRCVVPADGYYEWTGPKDNRQPHWFHRPNREVFLMAGLYESWFPEPNQPRRTFTIITTDANDLSAPIHDRMPVVLPDPDAVDAWLYGETDPDRLKLLLAPVANDYLTVSRVSQRVNSVKNDDPDVLIEQQSLL